jgi:hypothetical protein
MPVRIVTSTYCYKRPPRRRKAAPLEGAGDCHRHRQEAGGAVQPPKKPKKPNGLIA